MFTIGSVRLDNSLILAPLAGYTDLPFRLLCREYGAGLCVSEMISSHGLVFKQKKTMSMLHSCVAERPRSFQLFGADPEIMGEAVMMLNSFAPDIIDINMGCPVKKVTKRGAGAALMSNLGLAEQIIRVAVKKSVSPITIKIRAGTDLSNRNGIELAQIAEDCGVAAVTVHGRTWKQAFGGRADWNYIAEVKKTLSIPVIGNGDITSYGEAINRIETSGCDGIMIGRASLGNPWVFHPDGRPAAISPIIKAALRHIELIEHYYETPSLKLAAMKNHLGKYFKGFHGSSKIRQRIYATPGWTELKTLIAELLR